jgi:ATP-binding cassette, subfamily A (ABC1), member 3
MRIIPSTRSAANAIQWILRIIPSFSFGYGVLNIGNKELFNLVIEDTGYVPNSLSTKVAGADIIYLAWTGFFYFFMIFVVEKL